MRAAIIIPARLAAQRLPEKPLALLAGVPLVIRVAQQAQASQRADDVIIATDHERIMQVARAYGCKAMMTDVSHNSGTDRVAEVAAAINADAIINLQGDEAFVDPRDLDQIFDALLTPSSLTHTTDVQHSCDPMVTLRAPLRDVHELTNPNIVKVVTRDDGMAMYFSRAAIPWDRDGDLGLHGVFKHVGIYGYRRSTLERITQSPVHPLEARERLEQLRAMAMGISIRVLDSRNPRDTRGIDTPEDLAWAEAQYQALGQAAFLSDERCNNQYK